MYERRRNLVVRPDGRLVNVARPRGHLFVCGQGCCCGRTEDGFPASPTDVIHGEWERRRLRNIIHLTIGGCLGPCALANVVMLLFDGQSQWFHSVNSPAMAEAIYDHIERMLDADAPLAPPESLAPFHFSGHRWQPRPDGQPVDDFRPRRPIAVAPPEVDLAACHDTAPDGAMVDRVIADMTGSAALPRRNGELAFDEPWHGRAFGMAVALCQQGLYEWDEFRDRLIANIARAERSNAPFVYFEIWLATFEELLIGLGYLKPAEIDEASYQFEFGERDDVY